MLHCNPANISLGPGQVEVILLEQDVTSDITLRNYNQLVWHIGSDCLFTSLVAFVSHGDKVNDIVQYVKHKECYGLNHPGDNFVIYVLEQLYSEELHVLEIVADRHYFSAPAVKHDVQIRVGYGSSFIRRRAHCANCSHYPYT